MLGDAAVAVHPDDERYRHRLGQEIALPLCDRRIPIIADDSVDPEFGTGCVKITPAHDFNDYEVGQRHGLALINVFDADAAVNEQAPERYRGLDRFAAREKVVEDMRRLGLLDGIDDHRLKVPRGDRSGVVIEPWLTWQWYVDAKTLAGPAIQPWKAAGSSSCRKPGKTPISPGCATFRTGASAASSGGAIGFRPGTTPRAAFTSAAMKRACAATTACPIRWRCIRTKTSSTPGSPRACGPSAAWVGRSRRRAWLVFTPAAYWSRVFDIIFFWVARMIMLTLHLRGEAPLPQVYVHGLVRDAQDRRCPSPRQRARPIDLIDGIELDALIEKRTEGLMQPQHARRIREATRREFPEGIAAYGADALRFTYCSLAATGATSRFDTGRIEGFRNFCNKIWNASRFVLMHCEGEDCGAEAGAALALGTAERWIESELQRLLEAVANALGEYRFDRASQLLYDFIWNEYCDWYLELSKVTLRGCDEGDVRRGVRRTLIRVLERSLRALHPLMPFITEEIWHSVAPLAGVSGRTIMLQPFPRAEKDRIDAQADADIVWLKQFALAIRTIRGETNIPPGKKLAVLLRGGSPEDARRVQEQRAALLAVAGLASIEGLAGEAPASATGLCGDLEILVPLADLIDRDTELARLDKEIDKLRGELQRVTVKLNNENFVAKAPQAVVEQERTKLRSQGARLEKLQQQRETLAAA